MVHVWLQKAETVSVHVEVQIMAKTISRNQPKEKRGPGRPHKAVRKQRVNISFHQETLDFLDWLIGEDGNRSAFIEIRVRLHPQFAEWEAYQNSCEQPITPTPPNGNYHDSQL
jgi:hypothetical protein